MTAYRYSLLNALGELPDDIIMEAELPEASPEPSTRSPFLVGMSRFFNSGWGVAAVCFVVALGVIAGILMTSQGEFGHGRTETTAAETIAPVEPVTSGESETETPTEPETTETESPTETDAPTETETPTETEAPTEPETEAVTEAVTEDTYLYWDGADGSSLGGGKGTYDNPYLIKTPAHLSYLSYCLRAGINCADKCFRLEADLDLQGHPWIPIGIREVPFEGVFDGNGHTIRNLYINEPYYGLEVSAGRALVSGLFGYVKGATIKNLILESPKIDIKPEEGNLSSYISIYAGSLVGRVQSKEKDAYLFNCQVLNSDIRIQGVSRLSSYVGDMVGFIEVSTGGSFEGERLQCLGGKQYILDVNQNHQGVLAGQAYFKENFSLRDICMEGKLYNGYTYGKEYNGVVGSITNKGGRLSVKNMWAAISNYHIYGGELFTCQVFSDSDAIEKFNFQNAFGYNSVENNTEMIYFAIEEYLTVTNCAITKTLPENHGFSPSVWDLSDLSAPRLIFE